MKTITVFLFSIPFLGGTPAFAAAGATAPAAAGPAAAAAPNPEAMAKARELIALVLPEEAYASMVDKMSAQMAASRAGGRKIAPEDEQRQKSILKEAFTYQELATWTEESYATRFSAAEIDDIIRFYKTPTGQKLARSMPDISADSGAKIGQLMAQRLPALMKKYDGKK